MLKEWLFPCCTAPNEELNTFLLLLPLPPLLLLVLQALAPLALRRSHEVSRRHTL
jgi:hypothetical protein